MFAELLPLFSLATPRAGDPDPVEVNLCPVADDERLLAGQNWLSMRSSPRSISDSRSRMLDRSTWLRDRPSRLWSNDITF